MIFILIVVNFTLVTINWTAWVGSIAIEIRSVLVDNVGMELTEKFALSNAATAKLRLIQWYSRPAIVS